MAGPIPFNALHAYVVAAKQGSFSKAAEELNVTPAAVSQQIRVLEDLLGVQLFHRLHRGLKLTDAGQAGLTTMQSGFDSLYEAIGQIQGDKENLELNIWTSPSFASKWLMPRMHRFREQHPQIDLRISGSSSLVDSDATAPSLSAEILKAHNIDVAIRFGSGNYPGCEVDRFLEVNAITLCSPSLLADTNTPPLKEPKDLINHTLLHDESPYEGRPQWKSWFENAGLKDTSCLHNLYFNSVLLALSAAVEGQGVVLTLDQLSQHDIDQGHLVPVFDLPMEVVHGYHLVSLAGAQAAPSVTAFKQWVMDEVNVEPSRDSKLKISS